MKAAWDRVKLRINREGCVGEPQIGDELRTRTGRRYQILDIAQKSITCFVLPKDAAVQGKVWVWSWRSRRQ